MMSAEAEEVTLVYNQQVCHLCQKFFTRPKVLPCHHYFCESCLGDYLGYRLDAFEISCFPCPLCQAITSAPDYKCSQSKWASLFPSIETHQIVREAIHGVTQDCQTCRQKYQRRKSLLDDHGTWCDTCQLSLCLDCDDKHRHQYDDHVFMSIIEGSKARNNINYRRACVIHHDTFNDYYCTNCKLAICTQCVTRFHYHCQNIHVIREDLSQVLPKDLQSSTLYGSPSHSLYSSQFKKIAGGDLPNNDSSSKRISHVVTIETSLPDDKMPCVCEDIVVMTTKDVTTVILADINNNCLKAFSNKIGKDANSDLKLVSKPYRIADLGHDHIASTLPLTSKIIIVKVNPVMEVKSAIDTQKRYSGIAGLKDHRLLVSTAWSKPVTLDILNSTGDILVSISDDNLGRPLLSASLTYIKISSANEILVSDWSKESVICLTPDLKSVIWKYHDVTHRLDHPLGFHCGQNGQTVIADYDGNCITELSSLGKFERKVLTGVDKPKAVTIDKRGKLYIVLGNGNVKIVSLGN